MAPGPPVVPGAPVVPGPPVSLRFEADLELSCNGSRFEVTDDDGDLVVRADSVRSGISFLQALGASRLSAFPSIAERLAGAGLTLRVETPSGPLLLLGRDLAPQLLGRLIGAPHLRVGPLRSWVASRRAVAVTAAGTATVLVAWSRARRSP